MEILLSIKPEFSQKIFSGEKKYEFRKQLPKSLIKRIFIYESSPSKCIVGWFKVKKIICGPPDKIWEICKDSGGIEREKFFSYCNGKKEIYAIHIKYVHRFKKPINPFEINPFFRPPQNFVYFDKQFKKAIFNENPDSIKKIITFSSPHTPGPPSLSPTSWV